MLHSLTDGIQFREKGDRKGIILSLPPNVPFLFLSQWCHLVVIRKKCLHQCVASIPQPHAQDMSSAQLFPSNSVNYDSEKSKLPENFLNGQKSGGKVTLILS